MKTTYRAKVGGDWVEVTADWAQASCPVGGDAHGRQVADFRHSGLAALRAAVEQLFLDSGDDPEECSDDIDAIMDRFQCVDMPSE